MTLPESTFTFTRFALSSRVLGNPVGARHDLRSREAKIGAGDQGLDGREAVETGAGLSYGVTERYGAGY